MPLYANRDELVADVADYLIRGSLSQKAPNFVALFDAELRRTLATMELERTVIGTVLEDDRAPLPVGFGGIVSLELTGEGIGQLEQVSIQALRNKQRTPGLLTRYAISDDGIFFSPSTAGSTLKMVYLAEHEPLEEGTDTNWVLQDHPDLYLYGSLMQAEAYLQKDERIAVWASAKNLVMAQLIERDNRRKRTRGPLVMRRTGMRA